MENSAVLLPQRAAQTHAKRSRNGKIKVGAVNRSAVVLKILVSVLLFLTVYAFWSFDCKEIQLGEAIAATLHNMKTVFLEPKLSTDTIQNVLYQLLVTFCPRFSALFWQESRFPHTTTRTVFGCTCWDTALPDQR